MGSSIVNQRKLAKWIERLMASMFRSKNIEVNFFLPGVIL